MATRFDSVTLDEVNPHFYVRSTSQGVSRILAGSTIDGFPATNSGSEANLSVSTNVAAEADETQITVTATAAAAVSENQTVEVAVSGTGNHSRATIFCPFRRSRYWTDKPRAV